MSLSMKKYIQAIERELERAICLRNFPSQVVERHNKPEVEIQTSKELLREPVLIQNSNGPERCLIESSINSVRVSYIFKFEEADKVEKMLGKEFLGYLQKRAVDFEILRRIPIEGHSFSFLITNRHVDRLSKKKIIAFITFFMIFIESEISDLKISINARGRSIASEYMKQYS